MNSNQTSNSLDLTDLVYTAGFFDGEGSVNITRIVGKSKDPQYKLQISITNTDLPILDWLQERYGGKLYEQPNNRSNLTDYPRVCKSLWFTGKGGGAFLRLIEPYVKVKRPQLLNALDFQAVKDARPASRRGTPPDQRAQLERFYQVHREIMARLAMAGRPDLAAPPMLVVINENKQLELG